MLERVKSNWKGIALVLAVMAVCWWLWAPAPPAPEVYAPAAQQADRSVVLEKKPDPKAKPKQVIPKGAKVERVISVTVQPRAVVHDSAAGPLPANTSTDPEADRPAVAQPAAPCPPVTVDMSVVGMPDGTHRVIASSPDGEVVGGVDVPVAEAEPAPAPKLWAAGLVVDPFRRAGGVFIDRDVAFARLGLQVNQRDEGDLPNQVWIKAGIRF